MSPLPSGNPTCNPLIFHAFDPSLSLPLAPVAPYLYETLISACTSLHVVHCEPRKLGVGGRHLGFPAPSDPILGTGHGMQGLWETLGEGGVWPSGSQSNATCHLPDFCVVLCMHFLCVIVHLELWFSYRFFFFFPFRFFLYCIPPSVHIVLVLYILHPPPLTPPHYTPPPRSPPVAASPTPLPAGRLPALGIA